MKYNMPSRRKAIMPFMTNETEKVCTKCKQSKSLEEFRFKREKKRPDGYYRPECKTCEKIAYQEYQKKKLDYFRQVNRKAYLKKVGALKRRSSLQMTDELRRQYALDKATRRATRAKQARVYWDKDLTDFIYMEAHSLRKLRNKVTNIEWHVDHVIPLKGKNICGLHVWNNFAVIPKVENLRKGNNHSVHD